MQSKIINLKKGFSMGTQRLATQVAVVAHVAKTNLTSGLRICEEKSVEHLKQFEMCIDTPSVLQDMDFSNESVFQQVKHSAAEYGLISRQSDLNGSFQTLGNEEIKIWGDASFTLSLRVESYGIFSRRLVASAHRVVTPKNKQDSRSSINEPVSIECRWKRRLTSQILEVRDAVETDYIITADDVMSYIQVEATEVNGNPNEVAYGECGPFELDPSFRKYIDDALALGHARFSVVLRQATTLDRSSVSLQQTETPPGSIPSSSVSSTISWLNQPSHGDVQETQASCSNAANCEDCELVMRLSDDVLRVIKPGRQNVGYTKEWSCSFGAVFPKVILSKHDITEFELCLSPSESLILAAPTQAQRDILALSIRCFHARQWIANTILLQHATFVAGCRSSQMPNITYASLKSFPELYAVDMLSILYRLSVELYGCLERHEKCCRERDRAQVEKNSLEEDISFTLEAYQRLLAQTGGQSNKLTSPSLEDTSGNQDTEQLEKGGIENHRVCEDDTCYKSQQNSRMHHGVPVLSSQDSLQKNEHELNVLKQHCNSLFRENAMLRNKIKQSVLEKHGGLNGPSRSSEERMLNQTTVPAVLDDLKQENQRLKELFSELKSKYTDLENRSQKSLEQWRQGEDQLKKDAEETRHRLEEAHHELHRVMTERNRYLKKNEVLCKDFEKLQSLYETKATELAASCERFEKKKEEAVDTLRRELTQANQSAHEAKHEVEILKQDVSRLQEKLKEKEDEFMALQKKNQLLHTRLRKLMDPPVLKPPCAEEQVSKGCDSS